MAVAKHSLSRFLQHSGEIFEEIQRGEVLLERRDGPDLVVMTADQADALRTIINVMAEPSSAVKVLPWLSFLGRDGIRECLDDLREVTLAAVATGQLSRLETRLFDWRSSALACWDEKMLGRRADYRAYLRADPRSLARPR